MLIYSVSDFLIIIFKMSTGCQTPHKLYFGVKFYAADPCKLREEITRYDYGIYIIVYEC